jgi:hypothetical protein
MKIYKGTLIFFAKQNGNFNRAYTYNHYEIYKGTLIMFAKQTDMKSTKESMEWNQRI